MIWVIICISGLVKATKSYIAVNNSLYLGEQYQTRTPSPAAIDAHFAALDVKGKATPESGPYYVDDVVLRDNGVELEQIQLGTDYFGACEIRPVRVMGTSSIRCEKTVLNCPKLADLTLDNLCQETTCTDRTNLQLYVDYLSEPKLVADAADVALNVNCIDYMRYSFVYASTGNMGGYTLASAALYTDFGPEPSSTAKTVRISIGSTVETQETLNLVSQLPYRPNQALHVDNAPNFGHFQQCAHFQLKMGQSQQMACSLTFNSDDCTVRYDAVKQAINNTGVYTAQFYQFPAAYSGDNQAVTASQAAIQAAEHQTDQCHLPAQLSLTFVHQEKDGVYRLEGVHVAETLDFFNLNDAYQLSLKIDFVPRITRQATQWVNPLVDYLADIKYDVPLYTADPIILLLVILGALFPMLIYLYIDRDVHLHTKRLL